jgi:PKD repeat protein
VADVDCDPSDVSDKVFSITPLPVWQVIKPNGGEVLTAGTDFEIKWTSCGYQVDSVKIQYSIDGGNNWQTVIYRTANDGSYIWKVPNTPNDSCLVKVADVDCNPSDVSDNFFTIKTAAVINFDAAIMTGCAPLQVKFSNLSTDNAARWRWSFGDGKFSDEKAPVYTYSLPGIYTVKLTAYYQSQIDSVTKVDFIRVHQQETFGQLDVASASPTLPQQDCSKATDGDMYGWDGTVVLQGEQPHIIFSLNNAANKTISSVGLISNTGIGFEDRWIHRFQIQVSTTGKEASCFQTVLDTAMTTGGFEVFAIRPVSAKFVKLVVLAPQKGLVHLGEFEAYLTEGGATAADDEVSQTPTKFSLAQNYPNPFNPTTTIRFELPTTSEVKLEIYNILGEQIRTLFNGKKDAGVHEMIWDGKNKDGLTVPSGIYLYLLAADEHRVMRKMILAK